MSHDDLQEIDSPAHVPARAGTALALPLLDAMFPAFASAAETAARKATRLSFFTVPNGIIMDQMDPGDGRHATKSHLSSSRCGIQRPHGGAEWAGKQRSANSNPKSLAIIPRMQRLSHGHPPENDVGSGHRCGVSVDQVAARDSASNPASIPGNGFGDTHGRRVRIRLQLCLLQHHRLEYSDDTLADGKPARAVFERLSAIARTRPSGRPA